MIAECSESHQIWALYRPSSQWTSCWNLNQERYRKYKTVELPTKEHLLKDVLRRFVGVSLNRDNLDQTSCLLKR